MAAVASARRKPKRRLPPEILTDTDFLAVMRACGESDTGVRNQALIAIMYRSGLRVAEALALYLKDVDAAAGTVRVLCGKGGPAPHGHAAASGGRGVHRQEVRN